MSSHETSVPVVSCKCYIGRESAARSTGAQDLPPNGRDSPPYLRHPDAAFNFFVYTPKNGPPFLGRSSPRPSGPSRVSPAAGPADVGVRNNSPSRWKLGEARAHREPRLSCFGVESTPYSLLTLYGRRTCPPTDRTFPITRVPFFLFSLFPSLSSFSLYTFIKPRETAYHRRRAGFMIGGVERVPAAVSARDAAGSTTTDESSSDLLPLFLSSSSLSLSMASMSLSTVRQIRAECNFVRNEEGRVL